MSSSRPGHLFLLRKKEIVSIHNWFILRRQKSQQWRVFSFFSMHIFYGNGLFAIRECVRSFVLGLCPTHFFRRLCARQSVRAVLAVRIRRRLILGEILRTESIIHCTIISTKREFNARMSGNPGSRRGPLSGDESGVLNIDVET